MIIHSHYSLQALNTFGIAVRVSGFSEVCSVDDIRSVLRLSRENPDYARLIVLGGGSNMLFLRDVQGFVARIGLRGIKIVPQDDETLDVEVAAGESWDAFVEYAVEHNFSGVENLSLIPGTVGAAPIQNIGAYGTELSSVVVSVSGIMRETGEMRTLSQAECAFGYRDSVFKRELKDHFIVTSVTMRLRTNIHGEHLNTSYGAVREELTRLFPVLPQEHYTVRHLREAVCSIRRNKLPDPAVIGNAGSFFKNPEVSVTTLERIRREYPNVPSYPSNGTSGNVKLAAAWLIEQCAWKGKRLHSSMGEVLDAGVHEKQALVLVNYGAATGGDILALADAIRASVRGKFDVELEMEVNIVR
jgi:UDP-N-acetylmuramate dehydrogenase